MGGCVNIVTFKEYRYTGYFKLFSEMRTGGSFCGRRISIAPWAASAGSSAPRPIAEPTSSPATSAPGRRESEITIHSQGYSI